MAKSAATTQRAAGVSSTAEEGANVGNVISAIAVAALDLTDLSLTSQDDPRPAICVRCRRMQLIHLVGLLRVECAIDSVICFMLIDSTFFSFLWQ